VVTAIDQVDDMSDHDSPTGVCIVRAEFSGAQLLITLVVNSNLEQISAQRSLRVGDIDTAVDAVHRFLVEFTQQATP
jgi:hypothetical protein